MKFVFNKIPKLAQSFYIVGFAIIIVAIANYLSTVPFMEILLMQQLFITGAIVVAIGSVINTLFQFGKNGNR